MDCWDVRSQVTASNIHLFKKYTSRVGSVHQEIFASVYSQGMIYFSGIKTGSHVASFVSLLWKPELTAFCISVLS